ncbi:pentatricopeptide repeat-containing protein At5g16860-like [Magnolia sinica]|uniref:pentatricopeptide repeat-containing protein At5g16860-like n=1 Tax=Magnolia sinica TaxID=86752 RepID=UPI0026580316|nr:pentatricopeptide repeat-containing protein At5g16860-like [Magnolia sinica]
MENSLFIIEFGKMRLSPLIAIPKIPISFTGSYSRIRLSVTVNTISFSSNSAPKTSFLYKYGIESYGRWLETCVLQENLILGKLIHAKIVTNGLEKDSFLATKLIGFYSGCRNLPIAETIFNRVACCNVFLMNAMIRGYSVNGLYQQALDFFYQKKEEGLEPDAYTFSFLSKACGSLSDIQKGREIRNLVLESGLESDVFVSNSLIAMYAKCGSLSDGIHVFERMPRRDIVSWNSIISAYVQNGFGQEAMVKVRELVESGLRPDNVTIVSTLMICSSDATCRELHGYVIRNGFESTSVVCNSLISVYGKCGRIKEAQCLFGNSIRPDKVAWNAMISSYAQNGYFRESIQLLREMKLAGFDLDVITYSGIISSLSQNGQLDEAMRIFEEMLSLELKPDVIAIASILPAVSDLQYFDYGKEIHGYSYRNGLESDRRVRNALISVYSKCGSIQNARHVFSEINNRDVISWSSMVVGYVQNGCFNEALDTFREMIRTETEPNPITITSILSACAGISSLRQGKEIHLWALKNAYEGQTFVGSALIDMYAKCGRIGDSRGVFDLMTDKNLVTWNSMIRGYAIHGLAKNALEIFRRLEEPDQISFIAALSACSHGGLVDEGIEIFHTMDGFGVSPGEGHYACMVDILGRAGRLDQTLDLIRSMPKEASADIWGALLGACKTHSNLDIGTYAGERIIELGCGNPGYYVLLSNILADFGRWEDVEVMRKLMKERGVKKEIGCSWIEVDRRVQCFVARERTQHPEWGILFLVLRGLNELMRGMG